MDRVTGRPHGHTRQTTVTGNIWAESPNGLTVAAGGQDFTFLRSDIVLVERNVEVTA